MEKVLCQVTNSYVSKDRAREGFTIRPSIFNLIKETHPQFNADSWISNEALKEFKLKYVQEFAKQDGLTGEVADFVTKAVINHDFLSTDYFNELDKKEVVKTVPDYMAEFAGSWWFPLSLFSAIWLWMWLNRQGLMDAFNGFQFNVVDLSLALITLMQALFIMRSQKKEAARDRQESMNNFKVNLKNEFELMILREKINHITRVQNPKISDQLGELRSIIKNRLSLTKKY